MKMQNDPPTILLIGASNTSEKIIGRDFASGKDPALRIAHGFGGFQAAIHYLDGNPLPDLVHIANNTCMHVSDLENGCKNLAKKIIAKTEMNVEPPTVIFETKDLWYLGGEFTGHALPVEFDSLLHVLGFVEVETRHAR
jgi:hypothetical protein